MKSLALLLVILSFQAGIPQYVLVTERTFESDVTFLLATDVDSNNVAEILISETVTHKVIMYDSRGSFIWEVDVDYPIITAAAEDLNGDGVKEIFLLEYLGSGTYHSYRIIKVEKDGTPSWRKYIELRAKGIPTFHFIDADGKPGQEIVVANRILLEEGLERLGLEWDRTIIATTTYADTPYFLAYVPEEGMYELYPFDTTALWRGDPCTGEGVDPSVEVLLCSMFIEAGVCSCLEDWNLITPPVKGVRMWSDYTGDGKEEALFFTDTAVQLIDNLGKPLWTWESPEPIQRVEVLADTCSQFVVLTPQKAHLASMYVVGCTGEVQAAYALNLSGSPTVLFSDLDGDGDTDLLTFDQKGRSVLRVYANTRGTGALDQLKSLGVLAPVTQESLTMRFWKVYGENPLLVQACAATAIAAFAVAGGVLIVKRKKRT